jgi:hypothetical protein
MPLPQHTVRHIRGRRLFSSLALCFALATGSANAAGSTGVGGVLYRSPVKPVCRVGVPCDAPAPGVTLVFTRKGHPFRVRTGTGGRFSLPLKAGIYAVRIVPAPTIGAGLTPRAVRVPAGGWARVRLTVDTGIR